MSRKGQMSRKLELSFVKTDRYRYRLEDGRDVVPCRRMRGRWLVGADDKLRQELAREGVEILAVKGSVGSSSKVVFYEVLAAGRMLDFWALTVSRYVIPDFTHCIAYIRVRVEKVVMFRSIPFGESGELLRDSLEEANNDTNRGRFHVRTELVNSSAIWYPIVTVELHLFPDSEQDGGEYENSRPILELITTVHT